MAWHGMRRHGRPSSGSFDRGDAGGGDGLAARLRNPCMHMPSCMSMTARMRPAQPLKANGGSARAVRWRRPRATAYRTRCHARLNATVTVMQCRLSLVISLCVQCSLSVYPSPRPSAPLPLCLQLRGAVFGLQAPPGHGDQSHHLLQHAGPRPLEARAAVHSQRRARQAPTSTRRGGGNGRCREWQCVG